MEESNNDNSLNEQQQQEQQQNETHSPTPITILQPSALHDTSNPLHKLFQSAMSNSNSGNSSPILQQSISPSLPTASPPPPPSSFMDDSNNVMRFFQNITPTPTPPPPTQSPPPPSSIVSFLENSILQQQSKSPKPTTSNVDTQTTTTATTSNLSSSSEGPKKKQSIGGALPNLNFGDQSKSIINHIGVYLNGKDIEVDEKKSLPKLADLETQQITVMPCAIKYLWGSLISVNANFICYVVKGERIRVLERSSTQRALVKDIKGEISHIQFIADQVDLLSCATTEGLIYIYDIVLVSPTAISPVLLTQCVIDSTSSSTNGAPIMPKIAWSPISTRNNHHFTVGGANIKSLYVFSPDGPENGRKIPLSAPCNAFNYDASGNRVIFGTEDGHIGIWDTRINQLVFDQQLPNQPHITFTAFFDNNTLLVGTNNNREVTIFHLPTLNRIQSLKFTNSNKPTTNEPVLLILKDEFLVSIFTQSSNGYMIHMSEALNESEPPHFNYISEFDVSKPVISFTIRPSTITSKSSSTPANNLVGGVSERKDKKFNFYSIQNTGVNFHSIQESALFLPADNYSTDVNGAIQQFGEIAQNTTIVVDQVVPSKLFVPSSPPPLSLPDPSMLKGVTADSFDQDQSESDSDKSTSSLDKQISNGGNKKNKKDKSPQTATIEQSKVKINSPESLLPNLAEPLLSPNAIQQLQQQQQQPSPSTGKKSAASTQSPIPAKDKLTATIGVPPKTTPTKTNSTSSTPKKTPSFKQASINIPSSSSLAVKDSTAISASTPTTSTPTSTTPTIPPAPATTSVVATQETSAPSTPPQQTSTPSPAATVPLPTIPIVSAEVTSPSTNNSAASNLSNSTDRLEKLIGKQMELFESARSEQTMNAIQNSIQTTVKSSLEKIVKKELAPMIASLERTIASSHEQLLLKVTQDALKKLSAKNDTVLKTSIDSITSQIKSSVVSEAIEASVKPVVESVFLNYFQTILVPGFEKSCNLMFRHLSASFDKGLTESLQHHALSSQAQFLGMEKLITEKTNAEREEMQQMLYNMMKQQTEMQNDIKYLMTAIGQQQQMHERSPHNGQPHLPTSLSESNMMHHLYSSQPPRYFPTSNVMPPVISSPPPSLRAAKLQQYPEIKTFIESGDYSSSFNFALNSKNLVMVVDLCSVVEPSEVYSSRKSLHNNTIISLIQQLSNDFNLNVDVKLKWIKESLLYFDVNEPTIKAVAIQILQSLKTKIETTSSLVSKEYYTQPILTTLRLMLK